MYDQKPNEQIIWPASECVMIPNWRSLIAFPGCGWPCSLGKIICKITFILISFQGICNILSHVKSFVCSVVTQWRIWAGSYLTVISYWSSWWVNFEDSQWTHMISSQFELAVSFPWVCNSHRELATHTVSLLWAIREINWWAHHAVVTVSSL